MFYLHAASNANEQVFDGVCEALGFQERCGSPSPSHGIGLITTSSNSTLSALGRPTTLTGFSSQITLFAGHGISGQFQMCVIWLPRQD